MQHDLPTPSDVERKLSLKNVTFGEAREKLVQFLTAQWAENLETLAKKLMGQGFSKEETLELCESYRPRFEEDLTAALRQFDQEADTFIAECAAKGESRG